MEKINLITLFTFITQRNKVIRLGLSIGCYSNKVEEKDKVFADSHKMPIEAGKILFSKPNIRKRLKS